MQNTKNSYDDICSAITRVSITHCGLGEYLGQNSASYELLDSHEFADQGECYHNSSNRSNNSNGAIIEGLIISRRNSLKPCIKI